MTEFAARDHATGRLLAIFAADDIDQAIAITNWLMRGTGKIFTVAEAKGDEALGLKSHGLTFVVDRCLIGREVR